MLETTIRAKATSYDAVEIGIMLADSGHPLDKDGPLWDYLYQRGVMPWQFDMGQWTQMKIEAFNLRSARVWTRRFNLKTMQAMPAVTALALSSMVLVSLASDAMTAERDPGPYEMIRSGL